MFISNTATALLMAPIAIAAAQQGRFSLPLRHDGGHRRFSRIRYPGLRWSTPVLAPGGYRFNDFAGGTAAVTAGDGLTLLLTPLLLPL